MFLFFQVKSLPVEAVSRKPHCTTLTPLVIGFMQGSELAIGSRKGTQYHIAKSDPFIRPRTKGKARSAALLVYWVLPQYTGERLGAEGLITPYTLGGRGVIA